MAMDKNKGKKKPPAKIQNVTDSRIGGTISRGGPLSKPINRVTSNIPSRGKAQDMSDPYRISNGTQRGLLTYPAQVQKSNGKKVVLIMGNINAPGKGLRTPTSNVTKKATPAKKAAPKKK